MKTIEDELAEAREEELRKLSSWCREGAQGDRDDLRDDTFASTPGSASSRIVDVISGYRGHKTMIADVSSAFLHAWVAEGRVIIIRSPAGYRGADGEECLWMLRRMLYGLRDAPAAWQDMLAEILVEQGFVRGRYEPSVYMHPTSS